MFACCVVAVLLLIVGIITYTWFHRPELVMQSGNSIFAKVLGFERKYVTMAGGRKMSYMERGTSAHGKSTMVLVHGFTGDKESWLPMLACIKKNYCHIVALDMPGHGHSDLPPEEMAISQETSVLLLHQFITMCDLDRRPFHLVGISMGGLISGLYAREHPECVAMLSVMCPGMISPTRTKFLQDFLKGKCGLLAKDIETLYTALTKVSIKPIPENDQFLSGVLAMRMRHAEFHRRLYRESLSNGDGESEDSDLRALEMKGHQITVPTHIMWGVDDQMLHVSGAELLKSKLPNCYQVDILDTCGHMIPLDQPKHTANCLIAFRQQTAY